MVAATYASESVAYRVGGMVDDRLATLQKGIDKYYEAYQAGIEEYSMECAIAKVFCSDAMAIVADHAVQIYGGYGYTQEYPAERAYRDERINRIFEGTNEINRMLIPGTLLKRAMKGGLPLQDEVMKAVGRLSAPAADPPAVPFGAEKQLLRNLKDAFLVLAGSAVQRFMAKINEEQEVLIALADLAIGCFALESAILRAEKIAVFGQRHAEGDVRGRDEGVRLPGPGGLHHRRAARGLLHRGGAHAEDPPHRHPPVGAVRGRGAPGSEAEACRRHAREGALPDLLRLSGSGLPRRPLPSPETLPFRDGLLALYGSAWSIRVSLPP